jgi:hypothetical protein
MQFLYTDILRRLDATLQLKFLSNFNFSLFFEFVRIIF